MTMNVVKLYMLLRLYATIIQLTILMVTLMLQCYLCLSSVCDVCIMAKRCVLVQKLLLTAYRKSYMRNRLVPK